MEIKAKFDHFNINVTNLERSIAFYEKALGLKEHHRKEASNGSFTLVYLTDNSIGFLLELTCLKDHPQAYELGENESHLCFRVAGDYEAIHQYHKEMGWVCFENTAMGLYFIHDPDDYWIEVLPAKSFYHLIISFMTTCPFLSYIRLHLGSTGTMFPGNIRFLLGFSFHLSIFLRFVFLSSKDDTAHYCIFYTHIRFLLLLHL